MRSKWIIPLVPLAGLPLLLALPGMRVSGERSAASGTAMPHGDNVVQKSPSNSDAPIYVRILGDEYVPTNTTYQWTSEVTEQTPTRYQWYMNGDSIGWGTSPSFAWHVEEANIMLHLVVWAGAASDTAAMTVYVGMGDDC